MKIRGDFSLGGGACHQHLLRAMDALMDHQGEVARVRHFPSHFLPNSLLESST
jgi:hypothetical protein